VGQNGQDRPSRALAASLFCYPSGMGIHAPEDFEHTEVLRPKLVSGLVIEGGKLLVVFNVKHGKTRIEPFGGKVEKGETLEEAIRREGRQELKIIVEMIGQLGVYETQTPEGPFDAHMVLCRIVEGRPVPSEPGKIEHCEWFTYEELQGIAARDESGLIVQNLKAALPDLERLMKAA
jgi:ADP-ribose pyrophosphatase YjhB (NUDIX family)